MKKEELQVEIDEPPGPRRVPHPWDDVPFAKWDDWRWQLSHRLSRVKDLAQVIRLTPEEVAGLSAPEPFPVDVTPYFASLMDAEDPNCPIRKQVVPTGHEMVTSEAEMSDPLAEEAHSPVHGLVHRYPDRVLMLVTTLCASYCRFCTRSRVAGNPGAQLTSVDYERQLAYISATPQVRDVLLSGGDPLTLPPAVLEMLLKRLRAIPHVEIIRIGTRVPVFLPQRITEGLVSMLRRYHPLWMNIHFNHPLEITPRVESALALLADAGIPLGSQTVLLAGINDCPQTMMALVHKLAMNRVRPYYLYQCDMVRGAGHFRTPVAKGIEIMEAMRGHTSGLAIPSYVIDAPNGGGKVPVLPNYLLSMSDSRVIVRNHEGFITACAQPSDYQPHNPNTCVYCKASCSEEGRYEGVAGILAGGALTIAPEGWHTRHQRVIIPPPHSTCDVTMPSVGNDGGHFRLPMDATPSQLSPADQSGGNGHHRQLRISGLSNTEGGQ
jgi:lysine 2,3-aminomutase